MQVTEQQTMQKHYHDGQAKRRPLKIGQSVVVKTFDRSKQWIRGKVVKILGPVSYLIQLRDGTMSKRHIDHIRECADLPESEVGRENTSVIVFQPEKSIDANTQGSQILLRRWQMTVRARRESWRFGDSDLTDSTVPKQTNNGKYPSRDRKEPDRYM